MRVKRFLLLESLFLIACAAIAFLVMPRLCKNLGFSLFYDPKSPSSSLDALLKENEARIHSSQKYLYEIDPHHLFKHFSLNRTRFCFVIVTIPRPGDDRYLTQTIVKLVQQLPLLSNYTFTVYNVAGKAHTEAIKLSSKIPVTTLDEKTVSLRNEKFPRDKYNREKHDYQTALRWCKAKESLYSIIIEDDALVTLLLLNKISHFQAYFMFKSINIISQTKPNSSLLDMINWLSFYFLDPPLFIYLNIHRLLLVACCQLSSSTMGILLTPYLSRQHITA